VRYANAAGAERVVSIVGTDEVDLNRNHISWVSPLGRALMKSAAGDSVVLQAPGGTEYLTVLEVCYELWNRSVNHLDPRPRQRDSLANANPPAKGETKRHRTVRAGMSPRASLRTPANTGVATF
jgi:hypothetical protein